MQFAGGPQPAVNVPTGFPAGNKKTRPGGIRSEPRPVTANIVSRPRRVVKIDRKDSKQQIQQVQPAGSTGVSIFPPPRYTSGLPVQVGCGDHLST